MHNIVNHCITRCRHPSVAMALSCWAQGCGFNPSCGSLIPMGAEWKHTGVPRIVCTIKKNTHGQNHSGVAIQNLISLFRPYGRTNIPLHPFHDEDGQICDAFYVIISLHIMTITHEINIMLNCRTHSYLNTWCTAFLLQMRAARGALPKQYPSEALIKTKRKSKYNKSTQLLLVK